MNDYYLAEYDRWLDLCAEEYNEYIDWLDRGREEAYWADMHQQMHDEGLIKEEEPCPECGRAICPSWCPNREIDPAEQLIKEEEDFYEKADYLHDLDKEDGK